MNSSFPAGKGMRKQFILATHCELGHSLVIFFHLLDTTAVTLSVYGGKDLFPNEGGKMEAS